MLLRPRDFIPSLEEAFARGQSASVRAFGRWHLPPIIDALAKDNSFAMVAHYAGIGGSNTISWRPLLLLKRPPFKSGYKDEAEAEQARNSTLYTSQGTALIHDSEDDRILQQAPYGDMALHAVLSGDDDHLTVLSKLFPDIAGKIEDERQYDRGAPHDINYQSNLQDMKKLRDNAVEALMEVIDRRLRDERDPIILKASREGQVRAILSILVRQKIASSIASPNRHFLDALDPTLMDYLKANSAQPFTYYNTAAKAQDRYGRVQRMEFLLSPFRKFLSGKTGDIDTDAVSASILQKLEDGMTAPAAVARTLNVRPQTVDDFVARKPPVNYRVLVKRSAPPSHLPASGRKQRRDDRKNYSTLDQPAHEAWRKMVVTLDDIPASLWPRNSHEWFAFHRLQDNLDETPEALPARLGIVMAAIGQREHNPHLRWLMAENRFLGKVSPSIDTRHGESTQTHQGIPGGKTVWGPYWSADYDADGKFVDMDVQVTLLNDKTARAYNQFHALHFREKVELIESYNPDGPVAPSKPGYPPESGPRRT